VFCGRFFPAQPESALLVETQRDEEVSQALYQATDIQEVLQTLPNGKVVQGVTSLDNLIYVLRGFTSSEQIEVTIKTLTAYSANSLFPGLAGIRLATQVTS